MCVSGLCSICKYCFIICVFIYGTFHMTFEMIQTVVPVGFILMGFISIGLYAIRVPPPDPEIVEMVIGRPLRDEEEDSSGYFMKSVAHRGAGLDAPENSLIAFDLCGRKGCTAIEFDVSLTADDIPILYHDESLERMTESDQIISKATWEDLSKYDISVKHPFKDRFVNTRIPTLNEAIEQLLKSDQRMFIDIKAANGKIIDIILNLYERYPELYSRAIITSFYPNLIYYIRRTNPKIVGALAWRPHCFNNVSYNAVTGPGERRSDNFVMCSISNVCDILHEWLLPRLTYNLLGLSFVLLHKDVISPKVVADWQAKGVRVIAWTVNHPVDKQYFARSLKVTYMTDTWTAENTAHSSLN